MYSPDPTDQERTAAAGNEQNLSARVFLTERSAKQLLCKLDDRCRLLSPRERKAVLVAFAMCGKALVGAAYDAVRLSRDVDLADPSDIAANIDAVTLLEVKSTGRETINDSLAGYFFNITAAELLTAQALKHQYRFVFLNTVRGEIQELGIAEVLARAKAIYPAYHIRF